MIKWRRTLGFLNVFMHVPVEQCRLLSSLWQEIIGQYNHGWQFFSDPVLFVLLILLFIRLLFRSILFHSFVYFYFSMCIFSPGWQKNKNFKEPGWQLTHTSVIWQIGYRTLFSLAGNENWKNLLAGSEERVFFSQDR